MPRRITSIRTDRSAQKRHQRNLKIKRELKKTFKKFEALLSAKSVGEAKTLLGKLFSQLDKAAKKKVIHRATANRKKSRLAKRLAKSA